MRAAGARERRLRGLTRLELAVLAVIEAEPSIDTAGIAAKLNLMVATARYAQKAIRRRRLAW